MNTLSELGGFDSHFSSLLERLELAMTSAQTGDGHVGWRLSPSALSQHAATGSGSRKADCGCRVHQHHGSTERHSCLFGAGKTKVSSRN